MSEFDVFEFISSMEPICEYDDIVYDLSNEELIQLNENIKDNIFQDENGTTTNIPINDRTMILHVPNNLPEKYNLVLFFHGLGDHPWDMALNQTKWRELSNKYKFIIALACGTNCGEYHDRRCGFNVKNPEHDLKYMNDMIKIIWNDHNINDIYYVGFSNGGIFSSIVAQKYGGKIFKKIINIMGGFGKNNLEVCDMKEYNPCSMLFVTGTKDDYMTSCEFACDFFKNKGYDVNIKILQDVGHVYPSI